MEASQLFQSLTFNKLLQCTFLNKSEDGTFLVSLVDSQSNLNIAQILLNSRYAKPTRSQSIDKKTIMDLDIKANAQESVYISDIKTPGLCVIIFDNQGTVTRPGVRTGSPYATNALPGVYPEFPGGPND